MSDLAQVLLLPPPTPPQRFTTGLPVREGNELAVNTDAQGGGDSARARRFRFRVYEGSESSETSTDVARGTGARNSSGTASSATTDRSQQAIRYASSDSGKGSSSAFLAQAFAQEELGEGLHNPPFAAASAAYGRAGNALNTPASAGVNISV